MPAFGEYLLTLRLARQMKQKEVARDAGITEKQYIEWEKSRVEPRRSNVRAVLRVLGGDEEEFDYIMRSDLLPAQIRQLAEERAVLTRLPPRARAEAVSELDDLTAQLRADPEKTSLAVELLRVLTGRK